MSESRNRPLVQACSLTISIVTAQGAGPRLHPAILYGIGVVLRQEQQR